MPTIIEQIRELEQKKQAHVQTLIEQLNEAVGELNALGFHYELVEAVRSPTKHRRKTTSGPMDVRWATSVTRAVNSAAKKYLTRAQTVAAVRIALQRLAASKGIQVPEEVLASAEKRVAKELKR